MPEGNAYATWKRHMTIALYPCPTCKVLPGQLCNMDPELAATVDDGGMSSKYYVHTTRANLFQRRIGEEEHRVRTNICGFSLYDPDHEDSRGY